MFTSLLPSLRSSLLRRPGLALGLAALGGLALAGCASGDVVMLAEIAGGEKIRVPMGRGGPVMTNEAGIQISSATFTLNADKKIVHVFEFTDSRRRALRQVRVEDVSDAAPALFVEETEPKLSDAGQWRRETEPIDLSDPRLGWMATISNSVRVFRFTLAFSDGQTVVLHQGALFPAPIKAAVRQTLGQNY